MSDLLVCRLEFDAYRADLEELNMGPRDAVTMARIDAAQQQYQIQKDKYERLRSDVTIKLKFLEENKVCSSVTLITKCLCDILNAHVISHCISH